jgi:hypothetical protein
MFSLLEIPSLLPDVRRKSTPNAAAPNASGRFGASCGRCPFGSSWPEAPVEDRAGSQTQVIPPVLASVRLQRIWRSAAPEAKLPDNIDHSSGRLSSEPGRSGTATVVSAATFCYMHQAIVAKLMVASPHLSCGFR